MIDGRRGPGGAALEFAGDLLEELGIDLGLDDLFDGPLPYDLRAHRNMTLIPAVIMGFLITPYASC